MDTMDDRVVRSCLMKFGTVVASVKAIDGFRCLMGDRALGLACAWCASQTCGAAWSQQLLQREVARHATAMSPRMLFHVQDIDRILRSAFAGAGQVGSSMSVGCIVLLFPPIEAVALWCVLYAIVLVLLL